MAWSLSAQSSVLFSSSFWSHCSEGLFFSTLSVMCPCIFSSPIVDTAGSLLCLSSQLHSARLQSCLGCLNPTLKLHPLLNAPFLEGNTNVTGTYEDGDSHFQSESLQQTRHVLYLYYLEGGERGRMQVKDAASVLERGRLCPLRPAAEAALWSPGTWASHSSSSENRPE